MGFVKAITGRGLTTSIALELTDLGIPRWDADRNCIVAVFGDSFDFNWGSNWRSPVIACFDADFNCLGVPIKGGIATRPARQAWEYAHNNPDFSTALPTDIIRIGTTWYMFVMLTQGLGNERMTECWQSENLVDWALTGFGFKHPGSDPCTTMLSFDQFGDDIFAVGTHGLRRDGPIKLWKTPASTFPKGVWEPLGVIHEGRHGELCLRNVQGQAVLSFFDEGNYKQTALTVVSPEDDWGQANQVDYVTGEELSQLYGGFIAPNSRLNEENGMRFWVSQWVTATNFPYHVMEYSATLQAKGALTDEREIMACTENGWPGCPATPDMLNWVTVPGCNPPVKLQIAKGQPTQILKAFCADYNEFVEKLEDADTACFTQFNSVNNSNHRSGTAVDLNWDRHPFHVSYAGFPDDKILAIRDLLKFYTQDDLPLIYWGQDWGMQGIGPYDCMHLQLNCDTYNNPKTAEWISKNIRPDGFSTYKRGPQTTPVVDDAAVDVLSEVMGGSLPRERYAELLPAFSKFLHEADCTTVERIAMAAAQLGHESGGLLYQHEIADGSAYEGRADLKNNQPGDGPRFRGAGWVQCTGRGNFESASQWAFERGLVPTPTYFVDNPDELSSDQYCWVGPAWFWQSH